MNERHKEALSVLGYFFLLNGKTGKALVLFRALRALFPEEPLFAKSLSYACLAAGDYKRALAESDAFLAGESRPEARAAGHLLQSKACFSLGETARARDKLDEFLGAGGEK